MVEPEPDNRNRWIQIGLPLLIFIVYGWIARLPDLRLAVPEWVGASAVIVLALGFAYFYESRGKGGGWSVAFIIGLGAVFRMMFLMRPPELSDDIYRYLFDGQMLLSGNNPYAASPLDAVFSHPWLAGLAARVNHADLPTIYPPAAQFVFAVGALAGSAFGMKLTLVVFDILTCLLMARMLRILGLSTTGLILYAWHPLAVIEIAGSGHIDAAVIFFLLLSLFFLMAKTPRGGIPSGWATGFFFAAAVLTKWLPLMFLPGMVLLSGFGRLRQAVCGFILSSAVFIGLFWPEVQNGFHTLFIYVANWEFSGFAFRLLRTLSGSGKIARLILVLAATAVSGVLYFRCFRSVGGFRQGDTIDNGVLIFRTFYGLSMAFLLLTPTLHPWYALYLAALLPFAAGPAGLVLSWSVLLGYRVVILYTLTGQWVENDWIPLLIVAGPAAAWIAGKLAKSSCTPDQCF